MRWLWLRRLVLLGSLAAGCGESRLAAESAASVQSPDADVATEPAVDAAGPRRDRDAASPVPADGGGSGMAVDAALDAASPAVDARSLDGGGDGVELDSTLDPPAPDFAGTWVGTVESFQSPSGSDAIRLELHVEPEPGGVVLFGMGPAEAAPDPKSVKDTLESRDLHERYAYPLRDVVLEDDRVRFKVDTNDIWQDFCAAQPPIEDDDAKGNYRCVPGWSFSRMPTDEPGACYLTNPATGQNEEFDCGRLWLCRTLGFCRCDDAACWSTGGRVVAFEATVSGPEMRATIDGLSFSGQHASLTKR